MFLYLSKEEENKSKMTYWDSKIMMEGLCLILFISINMTKIFLINIIEEKETAKK